VYATMRLLSNR